MAARGELPVWVDLALIPAPEPPVRFGDLRPGGAHHRRKSAGSHVDHAERRCGLAQGLGLSPLLRHQLRLHRPCRGRRLPRRTLQHRRRRPGLHGGRRCCRRRLKPRIPALAARDPAFHPRLHGSRRLLGLGAGRPAGEARQPHRHHHHHVQLYRAQPDGLSHQLLASAPWARWRSKAARSPAPTS